MTKKPQGGQREGAGRKPSGITMKRGAFRISEELSNLMKEKGYTAREVLEWAIPLITKKENKS